MLTDKEIKLAIKCLNDKNYFPGDMNIHHIIQSLHIYQVRDEWDGSFKSAKECLLDAGYEVE